MDGNNSSPDNVYMALKMSIKEHHVHKNIWTSVKGQPLEVSIEADNQVDKFTVSVKENSEVVGDLKKGYTGWALCKDNFFFLQSDIYSSNTAVISGRRCNLGDGEGLQVPCKTNISGQKKYIDALTLFRIGFF